MAKITDKIDKLIGPVIVDMGYELVGVEYLASGKHSILRVYIDSDEGIRIDDCEVVSRQISAILDVEEAMTGRYNLEVSSPGIQRRLFCIAHYQRFLGHDVKLRLVRPINGKRQFSGTIGRVSDKNNSIELVTALGPVALEFDLIEKAHLVVDL